MFSVQIFLEQFKINSVYPMLRKSEKTVADYIIRNSHKISRMTLRDIAESSGVSQPTVIRMLKTAGFNGFSDFKRKLKMKNSVEETFSKSCDIHPWNTVEEIPAKVIASSVRMLEETLKSTDVKILEKAIKILSEAQSISIYAVENSYAVSLDFANKLTYLGKKCIIYPDTFLQGLSATALNENDAAIGISLSGKSIDIVEALKNAHKSGAKTIALTNGTNSPICKYADIILDTGNSDMKICGDSIFSRITQTAVVNMLYIGIILSNYEYYSEILMKNENLIADKHYNTSG